MFVKSLLLPAVLVNLFLFSDLNLFDNLYQITLWLSFYVFLLPRELTVLTFEC